VSDLIARVARRLERARLFYGHGTDNAWDEAAALVWHGLKLPRVVKPAHYQRRAQRAQIADLERLVKRRIKDRVPAAYLTGETSFAGLWFRVDSRVLIPRSPMAELIERRFAPWIDAPRVRSILDIGTGSGCIAIAAARAFPRARVTAVDISPPALEVAAQNVRRYRMGRRVRLLESNHFSALGSVRYDMILSNPPYVSAAEMRGLLQSTGMSRRLRWLRAAMVWTRCASSCVNSCTRPDATRRHGSRSRTSRPRWSWWAWAWPTP